MLLAGMAGAWVLVSAIELTASRRDAQAGRADAAAGKPRLAAAPLVAGAACFGAGAVLSDDLLVRVLLATGAGANLVAAAANVRAARGATGVGRIR